MLLAYSSRVTKRAESIEEEFAKYREKTEKSQVDEISSLTQDFNNREEILKVENARLTSSLFTSSTSLTELRAKLGKLLDSFLFACLFFLASDKCPEFVSIVSVHYIL